MALLAAASNGSCAAARPVVAVSRAADRLDLRKVRGGSGGRGAAAAAAGIAAAVALPTTPLPLAGRVRTAALALAAGVAAAGPRRPGGSSLGASLRLVRPFF